MSITSLIKSNPAIKKLAHRALIPKNQARPRFWVRWLVNPFVHHKGKGALIRRNARMDILPFNRFSLGDNSTIEDFTTINNGVGDVTIGNRSRIGIGSTVIGPVSIGNDVIIAQNVVISGLNHKYEDVTLPVSKQGVWTNQITVEDEAWIAANCVILSGVKIGKHAVVSEGSVVRRNVPAYSVVSGNPAVVMKKRNPETGIWEWKI